LANASCESFMKTLKHEEIYANDYRDRHHLRANIGDFIERYYNCCRLHSALGYRPPEEFEQAASSGGTYGATMSFFRHREIFRSDMVVDPTKLGPGYRLPLVGPEAQSKDATEGTRPAHRLDESPAGYSLAGWSPPEPASASPAEHQFEGDGVA
jgi:hypothetical protein